jgi:hypothetical protein
VGEDVGVIERIHWRGGMSAVEYGIRVLYWFSLPCEDEDSASSTICVTLRRWDLRESALSCIIEALLHFFHKN